MPFYSTEQLTKINEATKWNICYKIIKQSNNASRQSTQMSNYSQCLAFVRILHHFPKYKLSKTLDNFEWLSKWQFKCQFSAPTQLVATVKLLGTTSKRVDKSQMHLNLGQRMHGICLVSLGQQ